MPYNKIILLDLRNADIEIFNNWLSTTNYISSEPTKNLLKSYINNGTENAVAMVYMIDNFPLADCKKSNLLKIDFDEYSFSELQNLIPIQLKDIEIYRSVIIDWIFNANTEKTKIAQELWEFQNYDNLDDLLYAPFVRNVMAIDVKELGFRLREFFVPLHQKFKAIHQFFSTTYEVKQLLDKVHLTRIFVMDEYIIGYNFQLEGENQEHFFINIHLEEQLLRLEPFTFQDTRVLTVDTLLEKIFANGIKSLTPKEKDFLDKQ
ncbi:MAG: DUF6576 domain-containing protein [Flavobacteriaceae bacterium]